MRMTALRKSLSLILLIVLIAAMALITAGCGDNKDTGKTKAPVTTVASTEVPVTTTASSDITVLGEGAKVFDFTVTDFDGKETAFEIHTDKETVGEALLELGLIEGDDGEFGLYVKVVNGIKADYDTDGKYWAFYVDGEYALTGVDFTNIEEDKTYSFKVE